MIQILWKCEQCNDYGTIDLTPDYYLIQSDTLMNGAVQHQSSDHHLILLNSLQHTPIQGIVVDLDASEKNENSGAES